MESSSTSSASAIYKTAEDLYKILHIDQSSDIETASDKIEDILTRLDELYGMLDIIRTDSEAIEHELPKLNEQIALLVPLFDMINHLEGFVDMVKKNVNEMDEQVKIAKEQYSKFNSLKKEIGSYLPFFGARKKMTKQNNAMEKYHLDLEIPSVFSTKKYINK